MSVTPQDFAAAASMQELYDLLALCDVQNGWNKPEPSLWPLPTIDFKPAAWSYVQARAALDAAGRFVNTELAERRNLILANPTVPGNKYPTVKTLVAAYQMVKAGEQARSHRHTANALRLVLETGANAFTIVDGRKIPMEPGDVLLTPNWAWHGHSNEATSNAYWMDFLDVPMIHLNGPMFFERHPEKVEPAHDVFAESPHRFSFAQTRERLAAAPEIAPGVRQIELGAPAMRTIGLHVFRLEKGASLQIGKSTLSAIWAPMQGRGGASFEGASFSFARGDAIAAPMGFSQQWRAEEETYLLRVSDEPFLVKNDWLRSFS